MIDQFSRFDFESALPTDKNDATKQLWKSLGVISGEHCYYVPIKPGVLIYIRSSLRNNGQAAEAGADSIRCWLAADQSGEYLGSKPSRWIARTSGWRKNLTAQLRTLWKLGVQLKPCPKHPAMMHAVLTKNGKNNGRWFMSCPVCGHWECWLTPPVTAHPPAPEAKEATNITRV